MLPDQRLVECRPGESILPAALRAGVPFAHACGGNGTCSTCRIVVVEGHQSCSERTPREQAIADRLGFGPQFRLACQTSVRGEVTVRRLVLDERRRRARRPSASAGARSPTPPAPRPLRPTRWARNGRGRSATRCTSTIMFADIRGFTAFVRDRAPLRRHPRAAAAVLGEVNRLDRALRRRRHQLHGRRRDGAVQRRPRRDVEPAGGPRRAGDPRRLRHPRPALEELYGRSFDLNVGVHFGTAIVGGLLGDAVTLTAIGDTVNMASRIEQANKEFGTRFLLSDAARPSSTAPCGSVARSSARCPARPASTSCSRCSVSIRPRPRVDQPPAGISSISETAGIGRANRAVDRPSSGRTPVAAHSRRDDRRRRAPARRHRRATAGPPEMRHHAGVDVGVLLVEAAVAEPVRRCRSDRRPTARRRGRGAVRRPTCVDVDGAVPYDDRRPSRRRRCWRRR